MGKSLVIYFALALVVYCNIHGLNPSLSESYNKEVFTCLSGEAKELKISAINDDYCDCADGSDEPGTAACSNGKFYCLNKGHQATYIPSSRVMDGICDCCDGSDELETSTKASPCADTCKQQAYEAKRGLIEEVARQEEGLKKKAELHLQYIVSYQEKKNRLADLEASKNALTQEEVTLNQLKEELSKAKDEIKAKLEEQFKADPSVDQQVEEQEKLEKERQEREKLEAEAKQQQEEEQRRQAGEETYDHNHHHDGEEESDQPPQPEPTEEEKQKKAQEEEENLKRKREESRNKIINDKVEQNEDMKTASSALSQKENELRTKRDDIHNIENQISQLNAFINLDLGQDSEDHNNVKSCGAFFEQKVDFQTPEYKYELTFFKDVRQVGSGSHNLGTWSKWENNYTVMVFEHGDRCWGGPDRSVKVSLVCGSENKLSDVREPAKCEYTMTLQTPCVCSQKSLEELKAQL
eukprot:TRINITY_DN10590_c0_g1_i1.p1 TRINITY_DN10590_c0_g1~~TRINITY_DN10590_c0_g1_i1.p1  ORF type:complete len:467 (+),score=174.90 TRINITY_DN10590_c0_g1_i1:26-1426(+)